jgi:tRNA (adenine57-N1/adenine58-N1)-methyltransferase
MLIDSKQRRYLLHLRAEAEFHSHSGFVSHNDIIGSLEGSEFRTGSNAKYVVFRPTLTDHVLKMPRGAQVIYPKDLGAILMLADIHEDVHVLESGLGSGALSTALLRAGARITGYEIREDFAERAVENVAYNPSIIQVQQFRQALEQGPFAMAETMEVLHRGWHVEGNAVRPDHRMVAHTGFLSHARLLGS